MEKSSIFTVAKHSLRKTSFFMLRNSTNFESFANMERVQILGAGPAGLSAAINLAKTGYDVVIFEKMRMLGVDFMEIFRDLRTGLIIEMCLNYLMI